jgi:hypothetical protein
MVYQLSDPYRPPTDAVSQINVPNYTLYDSAAVTIASFLGGPIPGTMLIAQNYRRLGQTDNAIAAVSLGVFATAAVAVLVYFVPHTTTNSVIAIGLASGVSAAARSLQGPLVDQHVNRGGKLGSNWVGFGLGMAFLALVCAIILPPLFLHGTNEKQEVIGSNDTIFYSGSATKADADALGQALKDDGYLSDRGVSVLLSKGYKDGTIVSFVVKEGFWDQPGVVTSFEKVGREIAPSIGGFPLKVRLINSTRDIKREVTVGEVFVGKDNIYYFGSATESDSQALGASLKSAGYFLDRGFTVVLSKGSEGTEVWYVVKEGFWDDPNHVADFEVVTRQIASSVGGLPLKMRLVNKTLESEKEEMVN